MPAGAPLAVYVAKLCTNREDQRYTTADLTCRRGVESTYTFDVPWASLTCSQLRRAQRKGKSSGHRLSANGGGVNGVHGEDMRALLEAAGGLALVGSPNCSLGALINDVRWWYVCQGLACYQCNEDVHSLSWDVALH